MAATRCPTSRGSRTAEAAGRWLALCLAGKPLRRRDLRRRLVELRHDARRSLTVIRGEVELILSRGDVPGDERQTGSGSVVREVERLDELLKQR